MRSALYKDLAREIQRSSGRFLSIFAIIFIGVAFFAGVKATAPNMKYSMDQYYDEYNLMDIRIMSTLGLTQDDIEAICSIEGIEDVQGGILPMWLPPLIRPRPYCAYTACRLKAYFMADQSISIKSD